MNSYTVEHINGNYHIVRNGRSMGFFTSREATMKEAHIACDALNQAEREKIGNQATINAQTN